MPFKEDLILMITESVHSQIDEKRLTGISKRILQTEEGAMIRWTCEPIGPKARNFVTDGVYRVSGTNEVKGKVREWTVILKIVLADPNRSDPSHYNYWRREAMVYESGLLEHLPEGFQAPACYGIDEQADGSVWLWLEEMPHESKGWELEDYAFAAKKLGAFHAVYLLGKALPEYPCINRGWMRSWIRECQKYRSLNVEPIARDPAVSRHGLASLLDKFAALETSLPEWIDALERLPRTFSHQDYYEANILFSRNRLRAGSLALIDWQFASISGVGEDLGRFFGLSVSRGQIQPESGRDLREQFLSSYIEGLREAGWHGDEMLPRFGFLAAFALRSVWEVPKLLQKLKQDSTSPQCGKLALIAEMQMEAAAEAEVILRR